MMEHYYTVQTVFIICPFITIIFNHYRSILASARTEVITGYTSAVTMPTPSSSLPAAAPAATLPSPLSTSREAIVGPEERRALFKGAGGMWKLSSVLMVWQQ